ncbi:MAG: HD domain-containing protein [Nanoarchaeota archaeon]
MKLPTEKQCLDYFDEYVVPHNIFKHCLAVREVAVFLAKELQKKNIPIDVEQVSRMALLHDLFKVVALDLLQPNKFHKYQFNEKEIAMWKKLREKYKGMYETEVAYEILKDDFPEFAVALKNTSNPYNEHKTWEERLVHYADWRVFQKKVVSLSERLAYLTERYPRSNEAWEKYRDAVLADETLIFTNLKFQPDEVASLIEVKP